MSDTKNLELPRAPKIWRHPGKSSLKLPYRTAAAIAVMEAGVQDYAAIALAVGLSVEEVREIDSAADSSVRELCREGIPIGEFFRLARQVRCRRCNVWIRVAPCVVCSARRSEKLMAATPA